MTQRNVPVIQETVVARRSSGLRRRRLHIPVYRGTLLGLCAEFMHASVPFLKRKIVTFHSVAFDRTLRRAPDGHACSGLDSCFDGTQGSLLARAAGNEQNVVALKCDVWFFPRENILNIYCHLFTLIGVALQSQDSGMPRVSSPVEPLCERERLEDGDGLMFSENESSRSL